MSKKFLKLKWLSLIGFALVYNLVYLGRFNVNYLMTEMDAELQFQAWQQEVISISVFISYAIGSFINGYIADRYGAKRAIITGTALSAMLNVIIAFQNHWIAVLCLWLANGYFQSMIWVGGITMLANWWQEGERGKGIGIANFFSGMSHTTAYLIPLLFLIIWPDMGWRDQLIYPMFILLLFLLVFGMIATERPEDGEVPPYKETNKELLAKERLLQRKMNNGEKPWRYFLKQKKFLSWCFIAMISSICRYGLLNWIPLYYDTGVEGEILSETFSNLTLPIGMAFGTLTITWVAGTKLFNNKGIIITAMAAICGTLVVVFPVINDTNTVLVGIFCTGFALYGINGILWLHAIDEGCRVFAGSAAGILNGFAYFGAFLESVIFPAILNKTGSVLSVFVLMEVLCIGMVIFGMIVSKKSTTVVPEVRE